MVLTPRELLAATAVSDAVLSTLGAAAADTSSPPASPSASSSASKEHVRSSRPPAGLRELPSWSLS
ncbi:MULTISPECIES: hypothetical protein [unclassified Streptomyces]|uniref:hypothetical protein n=1 Tax=unclassified Streptomyces TaxID=2593676 RepID=UPI00307759DC